MTVPGHYLFVARNTPSGDAGQTAPSSEALAGPSRVETIGKYALCGHLGKGGMGSVLLGRTRGAAGFARTVAIKRLHPEYARDPVSVSRFEDEVRLCASVQHPNVVQALDVLASGTDLLLVMEYVDGATLHALIGDAARQARRLPLDVISAIVSSCLHGLHAVHEATDDDGIALRIVHRDISPQNIMVGRDGQVKVLDFGVAKSTAQSHESRVGVFRGKAAYMAPEQLRGETIDRRADVFASGVVLWEALTGQRLFRVDAGEVATMHNVLTRTVPPPSELRLEIPAGLDAVALRALSRDPLLRFATARDFALALETALAPATPFRVGSHLGELCADRLRTRAQLLASCRQGMSSLGSSPDITEPQGLTQHTHVLHGLATGTSQTLELGRGWTRRVKLSLFRDSLFRDSAAWPALAVLLVMAALLSAARIGTSPSPLARSGRSNSQPTPHPRGSQQPSLAPQPTVSTPILGTLTATQSGAEGALLRDPTHAPPGKQPRASRGRVHGSTQRSLPSRVDPCNPPTVVDADGIRHFKKGCL